MVIGEVYKRLGILGDVYQRLWEAKPYNLSLACDRGRFSGDVVGERNVCFLVIKEIFWLTHYRKRM